MVVNLVMILTFVRSESCDDNRMRLKPPYHTSPRVIYIIMVNTDYHTIAR